MFGIGKKRKEPNKRLRAQLIDVDEHGMLMMPEGKTWIFQQGLSGIEDDLRHVIIPEGVTQIGPRSFVHCVKLESLAIPESVTVIGDGAFRERPYLKSVKFPKGAAKIQSYAFINCVALEHVELPDRLTSIGEGAFFNCKALKSIQLPEGLTEIGKKAFADCRALEQVTIPASVRKIEDEAFQDCKLLKQVHAVRPENLTHVGKNLFAGCEKLKIVNIASKTEPIYENTARELQTRNAVIDPKERLLERFQAAVYAGPPSQFCFFASPGIWKLKQHSAADILVYEIHVPHYEFGNNQADPPIPDAARRYIHSIETHINRELRYLDNPAQARFTSHGFEEFIVGYHHELSISKANIIEAMRAGLIKEV